MEKKNYEWIAWVTWIAFIVGLWLVLANPLKCHAQQIQCPTRYMWQYFPGAVWNEDSSIYNDSNTSYLVALKDGFPTTITPTVGWSVGASDSFGIYLRADSGVFIVIQHDGPAGAFIIDTAFVGPCCWHEITVPVTPGEHNYSLTLPPVFPFGPLRSTVFGEPVHFGAAYRWDKAPRSGVTTEDKIGRPTVIHWFNLLGLEADSTSFTPGFYISTDGRKRVVIGE